MFEGFMGNATVEVIVEREQFCKLVVVLCMCMSGDIIVFLVMNGHYSMHTYVQ